MASPDLVRAFAPSGTLRASINLGNPILAGLDTNGSPRGVSVDLAREAARGGSRAYACCRAGSW